MKLNVELMNGERKSKMDTLESINKLHKAHSAFLAGCIDTWMEILASQPDMKDSVIASMGELSKDLRKSAGFRVE